jgi:hypothetical protein
VVEEDLGCGLELLHELLVLAAALDGAAGLHEASHLLEDPQGPA